MTRLEQSPRENITAGWRADFQRRKQSEANKKAANSIAGERVRQRRVNTLLTGEKQPLELPLRERNRENLSLYSVEEELAGLQQIAEKFGFPVKITSVGGTDHNQGYLIVPESSEAQQRIIAEAPINFIDYDDTQAQTSARKKECWRQIENLGVPKEVVKYCDKIARITFAESAGEMYQPELDMRLLTFALQHRELATPQLQQKLDEYKQVILATREPAKTVFQNTPVHPQVRAIFDQTRFTVALYPDTNQVLDSLRENQRMGLKTNIFALTYGDALFQFEKVLPLLQAGTVQAVLLTKDKKGPYLEQLFEENPFEHLDISYTYSGTQGRGINIFEMGQPCALLDDDPSQVKSVDDLAIKWGVPIEARRVISPEHKRADAQTPTGQRVIEVRRDEQLRITDDMVKVQADLLKHAILRTITSKALAWLEELIALNVDSSMGLATIQESTTRSLVISFFDEERPTVNNLIFGASNYWLAAKGQNDIRDAVVAVKEEVIEMISPLFDARRSALQSSDVPVSNP